MNSIITHGRHTRWITRAALFAAATLARSTHAIAQTAPLPTVHIVTSVGPGIEPSAAGPKLVELNDGTRWVVQSVDVEVGIRVTVHLASGALRTIDWSQVVGISNATSATLPSPGTYPVHLETSNGPLRVSAFHPEAGLPQYLCTTPCTLFLPEGGVTLQTEGDGYATSLPSFEVRPRGQVVTLRGVRLGAERSVYGTLLAGFGAGFLSVATLGLGAVAIAGLGYQDRGAYLEFIAANVVGSLAAGLWWATTAMARRNSQTAVVRVRDLAGVRVTHRATGFQFQSAGIGPTSDRAGAVVSAQFRF